MHQPRIAPLDNHSISLLRSGVYLHSFTHALQALTEISIKSNPSIISTSIDPQSGSISVDDNGIGIDKRLVNLFGRFDSKPCVSPPNNSQSSGLALEITSYLSRSQHQEGQVIFSAPAKTSRRHNRGTTTTVRNLFYNLPVRQIKETDRNRLQMRLRRLWNESKIHIQSLAITHPNITFTLRNSSMNHLAPLDQSSYALDQSSFYRISKTGSSTSTFGKVFGHQFVQDSIPLDFTMDGFIVNGLFARNRNASRSSQLIYLDRVLINPNSLLHKTLANLFSRLVSPDAPTLSLEHGLVSTETNSFNKSVTSTVDRYPVYLILLSSNDCPQQQQQLPADDNSQYFFDDKEQDLIPRIEEKLNKILTKTFLQVFPLVTSSTQQVHSPQCLSTKANDKPIRLKHSLSNRNTLESQWPVSKRARTSNQSISIIKPQVGFTSERENSDWSQIQRPSSKQKIKDYPKALGSKIPPEEINNEGGKSLTSNAQDLLHPIDQKNPDLENVKKISNLKSRFQCEYSRFSSNPKRSVLESSNDVPNKAFKPSLPLSDFKSRFQYTPPMRGCMKNPIGTEDINNKITNNNNGNDGRSSQLLKSRAENLDESMDLRRIDLSKFSNSSTFTVVGQLDLKFIIVKIHGGGDEIRQPEREGELIVAFDQHAVHERIRIEKFLKDMCTGNFKTRKLIDQGNSVPLLVNRIEFEGLVKFKPHFKRWGMLYEINDKPRKTRYDMEGEEGEEVEEEEFKQIYISAVPELIWDRVDSDGLDLVKKVLKGSLAFFEDRTRDLSLSLAPFDPFIESRHLLEPSSNDWFKFVKDCPTVLVDLLNSKACRGSIMFGDELNDSVCSKLIVKLSRTHLPFSCAHGRPTCFPLFKIPTSISLHRDLGFNSASSVSDEMVGNRLHQQEGDRYFDGLFLRPPSSTVMNTYLCKKNHKRVDWKSLLN